MHPVERKLNNLADKLPNAIVRISNRGVPHIVCQGHSVAYFYKTKIYRIFWPYRGDFQKKFDYKSHTEVVNFFQRSLYVEN